LKVSSRQTPSWSKSVQAPSIAEATALCLLTYHVSTPTNLPAHPYVWYGCCGVFSLATPTRRTGAVRAHRSGSAWDVDGSVGEQSEQEIEWSCCILGETPNSPVEGGVPCELEWGGWTSCQGAPCRMFLKPLQNQLPPMARSALIPLVGDPQAHLCTEG